MKPSTSSTVLLTDYAWPDIAIERQIIEGAGLRLVAGPSAPSPAEAIEALAREHQPAAILTCWAQVSATAIAACRDLRLVARLGIGLDNIAVGGNPPGCLGDERSCLLPGGSVRSCDRHGPRLGEGTRAF